MRLPKPSAPFEQLEIHGESITLDVSSKVLVIPTGNQNVLPSFNEYVLNPNRCSLTETPCGGLKNSIVQDKFPGSLTIEGDGCYLQNLAGTYTGKTIGAGKLSETSSIKDSGTTGIALATADGIEVTMGDGNLILLRPPSCIVEEFKVLNILNMSATYTITIQCPDLIDYIELYNIGAGRAENISFTKFGNSYTFSSSIYSNSSKKLQLTIKYENLSHTHEFTDDANTTTGLQNLTKSFIAWYRPENPEIDFIHFTERPKQLSYKQEADGTISQITIYPGNGQVYHGRITYSNPARISGTGTIPDCLNLDIEGSVSKFLQSYGMKTDFPSDTTLTTWVVPAISDEKILPLSTISDDYLGNTITIRASPGEYTCASFVIRSDEDINIEIAPSDLTCGEKSISNENVDIKYVKCWYQNGYTTYGATRNGTYYTPELLLNDDSFIEVNDDWKSWDTSSPVGLNYIKLNSGGYQDISSYTQQTPESLIIPISSFNISDSSALQPINLKSEYNKQMWITVHVPTNTIPGSYTGTILIKANQNILKTLSLSVTVLPITLLSPADVSPTPIEYNVFYLGRLTSNGSISHIDKTVEQFTADMKNLVAHGVTPTLDKQADNATISQALSIRRECGVDNSTLYYQGIHIYNTMPDSITNISGILSEFSVQQLYVYGFSEDEMQTPERVAMLNAVHACGAKVVCPEATVSYILDIADLLDTVVAGVPPSTEYSDLYHSYTSADGKKHRVLMYGQPQVIPEYPRIFRLRYGLLLWQNNYDGAMNFAYQCAMGNIWNDFDHDTYRDHCFTYPTATGPVDTIQWEGQREAVNDIRYLATLLATIAAHPGDAAMVANDWLTTLKTTDLSTANLDDIRGQMIDYILALQGV